MKLTLILLLPINIGLLIRCNSVTDRLGQNKSNKIEAVVSKNTIFGIKLRPRAVVLLQKVESLYKKEIKEIITDKDQGIGAESIVEDDGTPVIKANRNGGITEVNIVHELWHLWRIANNDPLVKWGGDKWSLVPVITSSMMTDLFQLVYDPIIHTTFYPEMIEMGYQPDIIEVKNIERIIESPPQETDLLGAATTFFKASLEIKDEILKKRMEEWYLKYKLETYLQKGKELLNVFKNITPKTPKERVEVYIKCLNILLEDSAKFEIYQWEKITQGEIKRDVVYISILPLK